MTGTELGTLCDEINGGAAIGDTLKFQLLNIARALVEQRRPWMVLRNTDTSKSVTTASTWQTAIDLSTITRFSRLYGDEPIKLFDGVNRIEPYRQVPWPARLSYFLNPNSFVLDQANKLLYLNGNVTFAGTLYVDYLKDSADITDSDTSTWSFPSWSHGLLAFMAVGMHKGGVDYDDINARMSPDNRAQAEQIVRMLESWDNEQQLSATTSSDPYQPTPGYRSGAININP